MRGKPHMDKWGKKIRNYIDDVMGDSKHFDYLVEEYFQPHKCNQDYLIYKIKNPFSEKTRSAYSKDIPVDDGKKLRDGLFDGEEFLARLKNSLKDGTLEDINNGNFDGFDPLRDDFDEWVEENNIDPDGDVAHMLQNEHNKNKSKRSNEKHPMESLDPSDKVGIFPISYVEYLEKQNDLLRKNAKGGDDGEEL